MICNISLAQASGEITQTATMELATATGRAIQVKITGSPRSEETAHPPRTTVGTWT